MALAEQIVEAVVEQIVRRRRQAFLDPIIVTEIAKKRSTS